MQGKVMCDGVQERECMECRGHRMLGAGEGLTSAPGGGQQIPQIREWPECVRLAQDPQAQPQEA